ncbi:O-methyl transferase B [Cercophora newfieldiana]|uniref:O-methyl transferase B n=1 Tax=Cercophora newfieldiana TaxID=92897 RepID=A0AA40CUC0_9PEZI|nr:O-methyl transferase B [Cercophora newfieldiana]
MTDSAFEQIRAVAATADESERRALVASLRNLASSFEDAGEITHRIGCAALETAAVEIGFDLGLFKHLVEAGSPINVSDAASKSRADPALVLRIFRYLAAIGTVSETGPGQFAANNVTNTLASDMGVAAVRHYFYTATPPYTILPAFLKKTGYKNPSDDLHSPFQDAFHTSLHPYAWFADPANAKNLTYFNDFMALRREPDLSWLSVYPVEDMSANWPADQAIYVNIGGSIGHQCAQFKAAFPTLPGRVILQDLPHSIAHALPTPGVENMAHNFWDPQPIRHAKFYYMRAVCHNHPDHKVLDLLKITKEAMSPESILLLDEMILPETGVHAESAVLDMTMMTAFASAERTEAQWRVLVEGAGLRLVKTYVYNKAGYESVMDVRL